MLVLPGGLVGSKICQFVKGTVTLVTAETGHARTTRDRRTAGRFLANLGKNPNVAAVIVQGGSAAGYYPELNLERIADEIAATGKPVTLLTADKCGGTLGLLALQVLRARGARVLVVSRTHRRLDLAQTLGAEQIRALSEGPLDAVACRFSGREGVDLVIETAGAAEAVTQALELVRPGGRVVLTGLPHEPTRVPFFNVVRREVTIAGSMIYQDEFPEALRLVASGAVQTRPLVTHHFKLDAIDEAFAAHVDAHSIKVVLVI